MTYDADKISDEMLDHFHHHCRQWAIHQAVGEDYIPPEDWREDDLYADRMTTTHDLYDDQAIITSRQYTTDELHYFDLVGMVDDGKLSYLVSCVDTSWAEVWRAEYPHGMIDTSRPYERVGQYLNLPEVEEA